MIMEDKQSIPKLTIQLRMNKQLIKEHRGNTIKNKTCSS